MRETWGGISAALLLLTGCGASGGIKEDRPTTVSVPVAVGCVAGERPAPVAPLSTQFDNAAWDALGAPQKAAAVSAQALRHQSAHGGLDAATAGCR